MKNITTIKRDRHGLYVRAGGYVFRPEASAHSYPTAATMQRGDATALQEGELVQVSHIGGTPLGRVRAKLGARLLEMWHSHGAYLQEDGRKRASEECWETAAGLPAADAQAGPRMVPAGQTFEDFARHLRRGEGGGE